MNDSRKLIELHLAEYRRQTKAMLDFSGTAQKQTDELKIAVENHAKTTEKAAEQIRCELSDAEAVARGDRIAASQGDLYFVLEVGIVGAVGDVTRSLEAMKAGDGRAAEELLSLVYAELRRIAAVKMAGEAEGHTLQPTALVHEAWLKLAGNRAPGFANRAHFFSCAAEAMRRILVESARRKQSLKRGERPERVELAEWHAILSPPPDESAGGA